MNRLRVSIAGLMASVLYIAIGFAALKSRSPLWASSVSGLAVLVMLTATVAVFQTRSPALRGFAIFGWAYLIAAFATTPVPRLWTDTLAEEAYFRASGLEDSMSPPPHAQVPAIDLIYSEWRQGYVRGTGVTMSHLMRIRSIAFPAHAGLRSDRCPGGPRHRRKV